MIPHVYHRKADKDEFWTPGVLGEHPPLLQTLDHQEHARKRKILAPVVSESNHRVDRFSFYGL